MQTSFTPELVTFKFLHLSIKPHPGAVAVAARCGGAADADADVAHGAVAVAAAAAADFRPRATARGAATNADSGVCSNVLETIIIIWIVPTINRVAKLVVLRLALSLPLLFW